MKKLLIGLVCVPFVPFAVLGLIIWFIGHVVVCLYEVYDEDSSRVSRQ